MEANKMNTNQYEGLNHKKPITLANRSTLLQQHKCSIKDKKFSNVLLSILAENYHKPQFSHVDLADSFFISHRHLHRKLTAATGMNFSQLLRKYRLMVSLALCNSELQIMQVSEKVGFSSCSYFTKCFKEEFGMTPKQYQKLKD